MVVRQLKAASAFNRLGSSILIFSLPCNIRGNRWMGPCWEAVFFGIPADRVNLFTLHWHKITAFPYGHVQIKYKYVYVYSLRFSLYSFFYSYILAHFFLFTFLIENKLKFYLLALSTQLFTLLINHLMKHILFIWPLNLFCFRQELRGRRMDYYDFHFRCDVYYHLVSYFVVIIIIQ